MKRSTVDFVTESNRIEGIYRKPTRAEINEHDRFVGLGAVMVADLIQFVSVYQPNAQLRDVEGMNVRVGNHIPMPGGSRVRVQLETLLASVNGGLISPYEAHNAYEHLHPFTDGNGRSGRALWYWMMERDGSPLVQLGFLHAWYYQSLQEAK